MPAHPLYNRYVWCNSKFARFCHARGSREDPHALLGHMRVCPRLNRATAMKREIVFPRLSDALITRLVAIIARADFELRGADQTQAYLEAILYHALTDCDWTELPLRFPSPAAVYAIWEHWRDEGVLSLLSDVL